MYVITNDVRDFIPESQKNEEKPLIFKLVPPTRAAVLQSQAALQKSILSGRSMADLLSEDDTVDNSAVEAMIDGQYTVAEVLMDQCVVGWENVYDEKGEAIPFSKDKFKLFNDQLILQELMRELTALKSLDEKK